MVIFFFNDTATTEIYTLSLHDALPISYKNGIFDSVLDGIGMGAGFTLCLSVMGAIRELLGNGTLFKGIIIGGKSLEISVFGSNFEPMIFMILPPGAFLTIAFLIAIVNWLKARGERA